MVVLTELDNVTCFYCQAQGHHTQFPCSAVGILYIIVTWFYSPVSLLTVGLSPSDWFSRREGSEPAITEEKRIKRHTAKLQLEEWRINFSTTIKLIIKGNWVASFVAEGKF